MWIDSVSAQRVKPVGLAATEPISRLEKAELPGSKASGARDWVRIERGAGRKSPELGGRRLLGSGLGNHVEQPPPMTVRVHEAVGVHEPEILGLIVG